ncbi:MAG: hypothetical protein V4549_06520 [Bacteroidota bacterium]
MSKKNKLKKVLDEKPFKIMSASIVDDFCNYAFEIKSGVGIGDRHTVKGNGIVDQDMKDAFERLNVHLAAIDDVFKHSGIEVSNIDKLRPHVLTGDYEVTGFKIFALGENEAIVLIGHKHVSCSGERMDLQTPKIPLDNLSSYQWYNELKEAADEARLEVELYKGGKCTKVEESDEEDPKQLNIGHEMDMESAKL